MSCNEKESEADDRLDSHEHQDAMEALEAARGSHERREALEAALDITATHIRIHAEEEVLKAGKRFESMEEIKDSLLDRLNEAIDAAAKAEFIRHPLTEKITELIEALSGISVGVDHAWCYRYTLCSDPGWCLTSPREGRGGERPLKAFTFVAHAIPEVSFAIAMDDGKGTVTTAQDGLETIQFSVADHDGLADLLREYDAAHVAALAACKEFEAAKERLENVNRQVDISRVKLQRVNLKDMGEVGKRMIDLVDLTLIASTGRNYLELL